MEQTATAQQLVFSQATIEAVTAQPGGSEAILLDHQSAQSIGRHLVMHPSVLGQAGGQGALPGGAGGPPRPQAGVRMRLAR
jgi:hypothetical protein